MASFLTIAMASAMASRDPNRPCLKEEVGDPCS